MGKVGMPLRVAVTGAGQSPALDVTVHAIGKSRSVERINKALAFIAERESQRPDTSKRKRQVYPAVFLPISDWQCRDGQETADPFTGQKVPQVLLLFWRHQMQRFGNLPPDSASIVNKIVAGGSAS
jgi:hypothetical protein